MSVLFLGWDFIPRTVFVNGGFCPGRFFPYVGSYPKDSFLNTGFCQVGIFILVNWAVMLKTAFTIKAFVMEEFLPLGLLSRCDLFPC